MRASSPPGMSSGVVCVCDVGLVDYLQEITSSEVHPGLTQKAPKQHSLSRRHTWRFYAPIAANLIASENRMRVSPWINADTIGDFMRRSRRI